MTEGSSSRCDRCGAEIGAHAPGGVCTRCLVDSLLGGTPPTRGKEAPEAGSPDAARSRIPGFRLLEVLGEGGFGIVHAAEQQQPVRRQVAVKILKHGTAGSEALARFEAERQALALMDHPGIARVFDAGETIDGLPYFVMERIDGPPITTFCENEGLGLAARLELFASVCRAVGHAHRQGVIHRDLKPSNVLVQDGDGHPVAKIIDFGIAKATESLLTDRTLLTRENQVVGTPSYMSPEQASTREAVDTRTDIYSLGVLLYELVTGTPPFRESDLKGLPWDEALRRIRTDSPPRPSTRIRELARDATASIPSASIPPDLDWIVMRALEKEPSRRYETADAMARDIARCLAAEAVEARPPTAAYRIGKFVRRHRLPVATAAAVTATLMAGTAVSLVMFLRAEENAESARLQGERARDSEIRGRRQFSHADFTQASSLMDARPALAVAHLARALRTDPGHRAATTRLVHALASEDWPERAWPPVDHGSLVRVLAFSPDGSLLLVGGDAGRLDALDAATGEVRRRVPLDGDAFAIAPSPDGRHAAVLMSWAGMVLVDLETGEITGRLAGIASRGGSLEFSSDGALLAAAFDDGRVRVWDVAAGAVARTLTGEGGPARARFAPDGATLAIFAGESVRLWDADTGTALSPMLPQGMRIGGVQFSPDGRQMVVHGDDALRVWDLGRLEPAHLLRHGSRVSTMAVSPDGSLLVSGGEDGLARRWDLQTGAPVGAPVRHDGVVQHVVFSPDGTLVATGALVDRVGDAAVTVWDARTGVPVIAPICHPRGAGSLAFHPDGARIAIGSRSRLVATWILRHRSLTPTKVAQPSPVWRVGFDDAGERVYTLASGGEARAWSAADGEPIAEPAEAFGATAVAAHRARGDSLRHGFAHGRPWTWPDMKMRGIEDLVAPRYRKGGVRAAAASDDGRMLVTGCRDGRVRSWSLDDGSLIGELDAGEAAVGAVALTPSGDRIACGTDDGRVLAWNPAGEGLLADAAQHAKAVLTVAFSPDGTILASGSRDGTARVLRLGADRAPVAGDPLAHAGTVSQLSFGPDGRMLATSGDENAARLWSILDDARPFASPLRHIDVASEYGLFLLWTPSGDRLVTTGSHDNASRVWDPATGRLLAPPMILPSGVLSASLRPDGEALLVGGDFAFEARLWDLESGHPLTPLLEHDGRVTACAFSRDGRRFVVGTLAGGVHLHDLPPAELVATPALLAFAEAVAGFRFNGDGVLEEVALPATAAAASLATTANANPTGWITWLSDFRESRTISPASRVRSTAYVDRLVARGTIADLREALLRRPGDPRIIARLGHRLLAEPAEGDTRDAALGAHLVNVAVHEAPDDPAVIREAAEAWIESGEVARALRHLAARLAVDDRSPDTWAVLASAFDSVGDVFDEAIALHQARVLAGQEGDAEAAARATRRLTRLERQVPGHLAARWKQLETLITVASPPDDPVATLRETLSGLATDDPATAVRRTAADLAAAPDDAFLWGRLGEMTLAAAQLARETGAADAAEALETAGFGSLWCSSTSRERLETVAGRIGRDDAAARHGDPWIPFGSSWRRFPLESGADPAAAGLLEPGFDDSNWPLVRLPETGGTGSRRVVRTAFDTPDPGRRPGALVATVRGSAPTRLYLNGHEILDASADRPPNEGATGNRDEGTAHHLPVEHLVAGRNVAALVIDADAAVDVELAAAPPTPEDRLRQIDGDALASTLSLDPAAAAWMRGTHATVLGDHAAAAAAFSQTDEAHPGRPLVLNQIGVSQFRLERFEEAAAAFAGLLAASDSDPGQADLARANLHHTLLRLGRHDEAHRHWLALEQIAPRDPRADRSLVDLTPRFNAGLRRDPIHPGSGNSLENLVPGVSDYAGIAFDVRGLVVLDSRRIREPTRGRFPREATIPIGLPCRRIHFLHGALHALDPPGTRIGTYRIGFADGTAEECALTIGENIRDWWLRRNDPSPGELPAAVLAWRGTNEHIGNREIEIVLHRIAWDNPRPDQPIERIEFVSSMQDGAPFLVGLTLEPADP